MATTAIIAELLIVGLQAMVWLSLLVATVFGTDWFPAKGATEWQALTTLLIIAVAYVLGVVVDRIADTLLDDIGVSKGEERRLERKKRDAHRKGLGKKRLTIMHAEKGIGPFLEYQRSRLRIARSTFVNLAIAMPAAGLFILRSVDTDQRILVAVAVCGALDVIAWVVWMAYLDIYGAYQARLTNAYDLVTETSVKETTGLKEH